MPIHLMCFNASIGTAWVQTERLYGKKTGKISFNASIGTAWVQTTAFKVGLLFHLVFQCLNRHSMGSDINPGSFLYPFIVVSMPQSAQHGFRLPTPYPLPHPLGVSMPQSAQHGFRQSTPPPDPATLLSFNASIGTAWVQTATNAGKHSPSATSFNASIGTAWVQTEDASKTMVILCQFQCLNRHSMGSDYDSHFTVKHFTCRFNASIGTAWVQTRPPHPRLLPSQPVSMPQSAQHGFRPDSRKVIVSGDVQFQCLNRHSMGSDHK